MWWEVWSNKGQVHADECPNEISGGRDPIRLRACSRRGRNQTPALVLRLNLKGLAGLCRCQRIIRLLSFIICQPNWLRRRCAVSLHFCSAACSEYGGSCCADSVSGDCGAQTTSNSDKRLWSYTISTAARVSASHFPPEEATPISFFCVFCQLLRWILNNPLFLHMTDNWSAY